jgi:NlpC/P60 family putative phage cell wall peptidase
MSALHQDAVVAAARGWIGTPYRHQASLSGVGCDCLGLVRGVWRDLFGEEPETVPAYSANWAETRARETLLGAAQRNFTHVPKSRMEPGDVLVFRMQRGAVAKHCGILSHGLSQSGQQPRFIHAYEGQQVVEAALIPFWQRRIAGAFRFPDLSKD